MSAGRGRTAKTRGVNDRLLNVDITRVDADPQAMLTRDAVREFIRACMCPYCPAGPFKSLSKHTNHMHGIDQHELRKRAGMFPSESIASPEFSERCRERAIAEDSASVLVDYMASLTPEEKSTRIRSPHPAGTPSRVKQGIARSKWSKDNPMTPEQKAAHVARLLTPEARAKAVAATTARTSKLTDSDVAQIRALYSRGVTKKELARLFGVAYGTVVKILNNTRRVAPEQAREDGR